MHEIENPMGFLLTDNRTHTVVYNITCDNRLTRAKGK